MELRTYHIRAALVAAVLLMAWPLRASDDVISISSNDQAVVAEQAEVLVYGPWGSQPGQFGKVDEASRPGPMDFAVRDGTLYVLDAVNARVQLFNLRGRFQREVPIGTLTASFMCVGDDGSITVLDAFVKREFRTFSPSGELLECAPVPESIGLCSAIWTHGDRVWIEERHDRVHEISVTHGQRGTTANVVGKLNGRPLGPSRSAVHARKIGMQEVAIQAEATTKLRFDQQVVSIVALESDDSGRVYLATACPSEPDGDQWKTDIVLVALDANGLVAGPIRLPNAYITDHYRKLCVSGSGEIIQMQTADDGVRFVRWNLPAQAEGRVPR